MSDRLQAANRRGPHKGITNRSAAVAGGCAFAHLASGCARRHLETGHFAIPPRVNR